MNTSIKTLVIRFSSIGDIVLSTPLLRVLRKKFPEGQLDYVTRMEYADLVKSNHNLNYTYEFDASTGFEGLRQLKKRIKAERYNLIVDIHDSLRSKYLRSILGVNHVVVVNKRVIERIVLVKFKKNVYKEVISVADRYIEPLKPLGIENDEKGVELHIPDDVLSRVSGKIAALKLHRFEKTIGFCPGARHFTKRWPAERYAELGIRLAKEHDATILVFGGPSDADVCSYITNHIRQQAGSGRATDCCNQFSLLETAAGMEFCDFIVTNDTGLMHIATARHKKIIALFGSTVKEFGFFPYRSDGFVLEREGLYCRPCSHIGCAQCPEGHFRCMNEITVNDVYQKAGLLLARD